jgi:hypothetical protein
MPLPELYKQLAVLGITCTRAGDYVLLLGPIPDSVRSDQRCLLGEQGNQFECCPGAALNVTNVKRQKIAQKF